jgi:hypothetical protein
MHCCILTDGSRSAVLCYTVKTVCGKAKVKVQESMYRSITGRWGSQTSKQSAHKGGKVVSPTQENIPGTHLCYRLSRRQGHSRKDYINEKLQWHHLGSNARPSGLKRGASTSCATACLPLPLPSGKGKPNYKPPKCDVHLKCKGQKNRSRKHLI